MSVFREDRLKELRQRRGISKRVLSELLGFGTDTIRKYESGERIPSIERLCMMADFFEVPVEYFLRKK